MGIPKGMQLFIGPTEDSCLLRFLRESVRMLDKRPTRGPRPASKRSLIGCCRFKSAPRHLLYETEVVRAQSCASERIRGCVDASEADFTRIDGVERRRPIRSHLPAAPTVFVDIFASLNCISNTHFKHLDAK